MTRVLFWKELREQAAVVVALVALGAGLLGANAVLNPGGVGGGGRSGDPGKFAVILLTMAAGVVVGATLFAGEREQKTFGYLDRLPGTRAAVWANKMVPGAALAGVAAGLLFAAGSLFGALGGSREVGLWAIVLAALATGSFGWGSVGSTRGRTSIGSCGLALAYATTFAIVALVVGLVAQFGLSLLIGRGELSRWLYRAVGVGRNATDSPAIAIAFATLGLFVLPFPLSFRMYTRADRERAAAEPATPARRERLLPGPTAGRPGAPRRVRPAASSSSSRLLWLVSRQALSALVPLALAPLLGLTLLIPEFVIPVALVAIGTLLGLLIAIAMWQDEQTSEAHRFWGERRIPAGRVWLFKTVMGLAIAGCVGVLAALPAVIDAAIGKPYAPGSPPNGFGSGLITPGFPFFTVLFLGPVTGFAFGQLAAMIFRKAIVAGAVAVMVAGVFAAVWLPSIANGGLHAGMAFAPAFVALLTARLLAWSWASDTIGSTRSIARLVGGLGAAGLAAALGLAVRAFEVDPGPAPDADLAFAASLPTLDVTHSGRVLRAAAIRRVDPSLLALSREAVTEGYDPARHARLAELAADPEWQLAMEQVAAMPTGVLEDPNEYYFDTRPRYTQATGLLLDSHLALGLRAQSLGDPADFVKRFGETLAAVRVVRNKTFLHGQIAARVAEVRAYAALGHWLTNLGDRADLLAMAQAHLVHHDESPVDPLDAAMAAQTLARRSLAASEQWMARYLSDPYGNLPPERRPDASERAAAEAEFQTLMWAFPWEKERLRRVVSAGNHRVPRWERLGPVEGMSSGSVLVTESVSEFFYRVEGIRTSAEARRQVTLVALALRRFHAAKGKFPGTVEELVPKYLTVKPTPVRVDYWYPDRTNTAISEFNLQPAGLNQATVPFDYRVAGGPEAMDLPDLTAQDGFVAESLRAVVGGLAQPTPLDSPESPSAPTPPGAAIRLDAGDALVGYGVVRMAVPKPAKLAAGPGR